MDWRVPLSEARRRLPRRPLQGNLDPGALLGTPEDVARRTAEMIRETDGKAHIVNLGHGVLPSTPVESVEAFFAAARGVAVGNPGAAARMKQPEVSARSPAPVQRPGSALHLLSHRARVERGAGAGRLRGDPVRDASAAPVSLYLHLPFCETLCYFCACTVVITGTAIPPRRATWPRGEGDRLGLAALGPKRTVAQLHWGGGTPTYFSPDRLLEPRPENARNGSPSLRMPKSGWRSIPASPPPSTSRPWRGSGSTG